MQDPSNGQVASFGTSFTFKRYMQNCTPNNFGTYHNGVGFAFTLTNDNITKLLLANSTTSTNCLFKGIIFYTIFFLLRAKILVPFI